MSARGREQIGDVPVELTSFVGRTKEIRAAHDLFTEANLVTVVGPGGVGKTRLALRVISSVRKAEPRAVVRWVRLAALPATADHATLERELARAVGVKDVTDQVLWEVLVEHLRDQVATVSGYVLVFDNCEHLVEQAGALVHDLLDAVAGIRILTTSREALGVQGERLFLVPPLSGPESDRDSDGRRSDSLELLEQRATSVGFAIGAHNRVEAVRLCQRLDGIPLAIELAAAGLRSQSLEEITEGLGTGHEARFRLLAGGPRHGANPMHHSLRAALDWSYQLCDAEEQTMWARLAVFEDGWDLTAAETVCSGAGIDRDTVLDLLKRLVDKSIVTVDTSGPRARYQLLETIRHFGQLQSTTVGETELRRRHRDHYLAVAAAAAEDWYSPREQDWMNWTRTELPNLRVALDWCLHTPGEEPAGLRMAVLVGRLHAQFFVLNLGETLDWLESALDRAVVGDPAAPADLADLRIAAIALAGWTALCLGDSGRAKNLLSYGRAEAGGATSPQLAFFEGVFAFLARGEPASVSVLVAALAQFDDSGKRFHGDRFTVLLLTSMATVYFGERRNALTITQQCLDEAATSGSGWAISKSMWVRGLALAWHDDNPRQAITLEREAMRRQRDMGDRWGLIWSTHALAWAFAETLRVPSAVSTSDDRVEYVARLLGAATSLRERTRVTISGLPAFATANDNAETLVRELLGPRVYDAEFGVGAALSDEAIFTLALTGSTTAPVERPAHRSRWGHLTQTEKQIAILAGQGLTNHDIARRRVSSVRTIEKHIENIRRKLNAESRSDIAAWIQE